MKISNQPVVEAAMLIRKPVTKVFEAFIDPRITANFWFTNSTGKLEVDKEVEWIWEMHDVSTSVLVKSIITDRKIGIEWGGPDERTNVEWNFKVLENSKTFVRITERGFTGTPEELIAKVRDSTGGFTLVLAGLKAYLEHGIRLNLVADRFPKELGKE